MNSDTSKFYTFDALDIDGNKVSMEKYKGKVVIVVNVASECGLTKKNYAQLQELHSQYSNQGLVILAFPCNQFGGQEPGSSCDIKDRVENNLKLPFDFFSKVDVNGPDALPLFAYLQETLKGTLFNKIKWNFTKFLIDRKGTPYKRYAPTTDPKDLKDDIEQLLSQPA